MDRNNFVYTLVPENNVPEIQLDPNKIYKIGRSPENNILITNNTVSREQATLEFSETFFVLRDLDSTNGTKVNGQNIKEVSLKDRDIITFGRVHITFKIKKTSRKRERILTPEETTALDEDLHKIIIKLEKSPLRDKLLKFQKKLRRKKKNMMELAYGDSLTGLYNRRYFDSILASEIKRVNRYKRVLTMIMVDIDLFKKFNDTYGHQKGDSVLRTIGSILKENSRASDIVCRYGGEELVILLPEQNIDLGYTTAEKLRKVIASEAKEIEEVEITASFGVSSTGEKMATAEKLIKKADEALYLAKKSGRNCTKVLRLD